MWCVLDGLHHAVLLLSLGISHGRSSALYRRSWRNFLHDVNHGVPAGVYVQCRRSKRGARLDTPSGGPPCPRDHESHSESDEHYVSFLYLYPNLYIFNGTGPGLGRVFNVDMATCPLCHRGSLRIIAAILPLYLPSLRSAFATTSQSRAQGGV